MNSPAAKWKELWRRPEGVDEPEVMAAAPASEDPELREIFVRSAFRAAAGFALLFGFVAFAFWWSGAAVRFGAGRAAGSTQPTWKVAGTVRDAVTHAPIPWAAVDDDPGGKPPYYHADAGYSGSYELLTLAEPHSIRIAAPGYHDAVVPIGRTWFLWLPRGRERHDVDLQPR